MNEQFQPDDSDTIVALTKHITRLEDVLKKIVSANRDFLEAVPHMVDEPTQDPITKACDEAAAILWPHAYMTQEEQDRYIESCYRDTGHHASCSTFDPEGSLECDCGLEIGLRY